MTTTGRWSRKKRTEEIAENRASTQVLEIRRRPPVRVLPVFSPLIILDLLPDFPDFNRLLSLRRDIEAEARGPQVNGGLQLDW